MIGGIECCTALKKHKARSQEEKIRDLTERAYKARNNGSDALLSDTEDANYAIWFRTTSGDGNCLLTFSLCKWLWLWLAYPPFNVTSDSDNQRSFNVKSAYNGHDSSMNSQRS
ncbi:hypothetical protein NC651_039724 [Populus alba x Populus x berolinensis]|nr:hypothetical protein NC651_039724 [Populus alba x Populus x berolinensis]